MFERTPFFDRNWPDNMEDPEQEIPIGDLGGRPCGDTYLIARHKDRILTPTGWHDIDEFFEEDDAPKFFG